MSGKTTLPSVDVPASSLPLETEVTVLAIAWYGADPSRVGEICLPPSGSEAHVLGRGADDDGAPRLRFFRQRPGTIVPTTPLEAPGLSRRQLLLAEQGGNVSLERVGKCAVRVNGRDVERATVRPGDVVFIQRELALACVRRAATIPPLRHFPRDAMGDFAQADAFGIIGESPAMWRLREALAYAAQSGAHTLILGETGSGKELAARGIHRLSARHEYPFVARNAATLPSGIIDAELFGNAKNYPNAGMAERPGLVGQADGGTLFLDEIGELGPELQTHLLRVLDSGGEYQRLGESRTRRADVRLVCATNRRPETLKHDFLSRLVATVQVPPLSARREDIPLLLASLVRQNAGSERRMSPSLVIHALQAALPSNVRGLEALLWEAMRESDAGEIRLPRDRRSSPAPTSTRRPSSRPPEYTEPTPDQIREALSASTGNVTRAARALGLSSRYALYRLMQRFGIDSSKS